jgi:deoxyhypusine synthase
LAVQAATPAEAAVHQAAVEHGTEAHSAEAAEGGKIDPAQLPDTVVCYADSTIALPIMAAYALGKRPPRPLRRLYDRRDAMLERLAADVRGQK